MVTISLLLTNVDCSLHPYEGLCYTLSSEPPLITMEPVTRSYGELRQNETDGPPMSFMLPKLEKQRSLRDLIGDCLNSQSDGSLDMAAPLMRIDKNPGSGGTTASAPASAIRGTKPETRTESTNGNARSRSQETTGLCKNTKVGHSGLWRRVFRR